MLGHVKQMVSLALCFTLILCSGISAFAEEKFRITELSAEYTARTGAVVVTGKSDAESGNKMTVKIAHESGKIVYLGETFLDAQGCFRASVVLKASAPIGNYLVECMGNKIEEKAQTEFLHYIPSSACEITSFRIKGVGGRISGNKITLTLPANTNVENLIPLYEVSDRASVYVGNVLQKNGVTAQDFSTPVVYTVVAEDGTSASYTVSLTVESASSNSRPSGGGGGGSRFGGSGGVVISGDAATSRPEQLPEPETDNTEAVETLPQTMFSDVPDSHWAYAIIKQLKDEGIVEGIGDNRFEPEMQVTTAEFAKMLIGAADIEISEQPIIFQDVKAEDWFAPYAVTALRRGLVEEEEFFYPEEALKREKMAFMLYRAVQAKGISLAQDQAFSYTDAEDISPEFTEAVRVLSSSDVLCGDDAGAFRPRDSLTRAEAAKVILFLEGGGHV